MSAKCPVCGSIDTIRGSTQYTHEEPFGGVGKCEIINYKCNNCKHEGDFLEENDDTIAALVASMKAESVVNILNYFAANKTPYSTIERLLGLPQRTLTKWKNRAIAPHAAGATLLKFLRLFPWMLKVAESKYDYSCAQRIMITEGVHQLLSILRFDENGYIIANMTSTNVAVGLVVEARTNGPIGIGYTPAKPAEVWQKIPSVASAQRVAIC